MDKLGSIGFYTLHDERARTASTTSKMQRCEMIITEYCNFKCPYCRGLDDSIYGDRRLKQLSPSEIMRNIDLWCPLESIRFSGGEPTLHKHIREIVNYARAKGVTNIAISTNGSNKPELYRELVELGVNDFSISLDACCADDGDKMAGGVAGSWETVTDNIRMLSQLTYVTVGVVLTPDNIDRTLETIQLAHNLGVADIRVISAAQYNKPIPRLYEVDAAVRALHPILDYRIRHFAEGRNVRGIQDTDSHHCGLVLDDSVIAGSYHFPCIIYMREQGAPIGTVGPDMREERARWHEEHDTHCDPICKKNCLDVCIDYNNRFEEFRS
jgi:MoaA/NifB/PqqE/SkfB family radical SAM enzyme